MHWRRKWQPTPVFLPGESQGQGSMVGCHLWGRIESDTPEVTQQQQQQTAVIFGYVCIPFVLLQNFMFQIGLALLVCIVSVPLHFLLAAAVKSLQLCPPLHPPTWTPLAAVFYLVRNLTPNKELLI